MRNRKLFTPGAPQRLAGINDFAAYTGLGRASAAKFGREAGCRIEVSGRVLYDLHTADRYLDSLTRDTGEKTYGRPTRADTAPLARKEDEL